MNLIPDLELSATAMVDPHAIGVVAPAISKSACRFADLARDANPTARIYSAVLTCAEIGRALQSSDVYRIRIAEECAALPSELKVDTAAMVYPDAAAIVAPAITLAAG